MKEQRMLIGLLIVGLVLALAAGPSSLSARPRADFNGDDYADLAVGVPYDDPGGVIDAGAVDVVYGSGAGLSLTGVQYWHQDSAGIVDTAENYDLFGQALAVGDFDGDGRFDLAVGVPQQTVSGHPNAGAVHILYGSAGGLTAADNKVWHQDTGNVGSIAEDNDYFGWSLAAGDFNGDGRDDLAVSAPFEDWGAQDSGIVHILYGSAGGLTDAGTQTWRQGADGLPETEEIGDGFGKALAVGDFNHDGRDDLVIGVPGEDFASPTRYDVGVVHVLYGSAGGLTSTDNDLWHQDLTTIVDTADQYDAFGWALTTGSFNGDAYDDLAVGVPGEEVGGDAYAGAVHILYGASGGLTDYGDQLLDQDDLGVNAAYDDGFGKALTASDFNGDGYADLAVGIPDKDLWGVAPGDCGSVNVLYGSNVGPSTTNVDVWYQGTLCGLADEPEENDQFGYTLAAGDFDGDGFGDLVIGVPYEDILYGSDTKVDAGFVHVLYGTASGLSSANDWRLCQDNYFIPDAPGNNERFGYALAAIPRVKHKIYLPLTLKNY